MRFSVAIGSLVVFAGILVCGQAAQSEARLTDIVKELVDTMDKLTVQLATIKDEDSARASRDELKKAVGRWLETRKKAEKLKPPSKQEKDQLEKEFKGKLQATHKKLLAEIARVKGVPGGPDALKEIRAELEKKRK